MTASCVDLFIGETKKNAAAVLQPQTILRGIEIRLSKNACRERHECIIHDRISSNEALFRVTWIFAQFR